MNHSAWDGMLGLSIAVGLLLPFIVYVDFRKHGRTLTEQAYWRAWWGTVALQAALPVLGGVWQCDIVVLVDGVGGMLLGVTVTFWYTLLLEKCLRILGAIAPSS